jgi:uncharacterized protein YjdB
MALLLVLVSCDSPASPNPRAPVAHLEVAPEQVDLAVGDTLRLHAMAFSEDRSPILDAEVSWWSADPSVVSVSATGLLTAAAAGRVNVRAESEDAQAVANVRVYDPQTPPPVITTLLPAAARAGSAAFSLTVIGEGFTVGSRVLWGGEARVTTFVSPEVVRAWIVASDLEDTGTAEVRVESPAPGGGASEPRTFTILPPASEAPVLSAIAPEQVPAGGHGFTLTLTGQGFGPDAVVLWNGSHRPTTRVSDRELRAEIAVNDIWMPGTALRLDPFQESAFTGQALDASGAPVGGRYMAWSSGNGNVAQVFGDGSVRALRPGTTTVRLANGEQYALATVIVGPHRVHYIVVEPTEKAVLVGDQFQFRARTYALGGEELYDRVVTWRVGDPSVATVDETGTVTALAKGTTHVFAESEGQRTWAVLDVREWPAGAIWTFGMQVRPGEVIPVGDTTWVDDEGRTQRADLLLLGGSLTLDRAQGTYTQLLRVWVAAPSNPFQITWEDQGRFQPGVWPQGALLFTSTSTPGSSFTGRISDPGELHVEQKIRAAPSRPYLYVIR